MTAVAVKSLVIEPRGKRLSAVTGLRFSPSSQPQPPRSRLSPPEITTALMPTILFRFMAERIIDSIRWAVSAWSAAAAPTGRMASAAAMTRTPILIASLTTLPPLSVCCNNRRREGRRKSPDG